MLNDYYAKQFEDTLPSMGNNFSTKIALEHKAALSTMFVGFGKKLDATATLWARRLTERDFTIKEVKTAIDFTMNTCERVPSFSQFVDIVRKNSARPDPNDEREKLLDTKAKAFREESNLMRAAFIEKYGEKKLYLLLNQWFKNIYPEADLGKWGVELNLFTPIFLQDLVDAKGDINKAIEIGHTRCVS